MLRRSSIGSHSVVFRPFTISSPDVGSISRLMRFSVVVLPQPDSPSNIRMSPRLTVSEIPLSMARFADVEVNLSHLDGNFIVERHRATILALVMAVKPTQADIDDALNRTIDDLIAPDLKVLFCGINPGIWSGATGLHFARPGNRFWKVLYGAGFTERLLEPEEEFELLRSGYGITCMVDRTTARAAELTRGEYEEGGRLLIEKIETYRPKFLAVVGLGAYGPRLGGQKRRGLQAETFGPPGWLLPIQAPQSNYQIDDLMRCLLI